jgi:hypothetical protein
VATNPDPLFTLNQCERNMAVAKKKLWPSGMLFLSRANRSVGINEILKVSAGWL